MFNAYQSSTFDSTKDYTIDSIQFYYAYKRNITNVSDTVRAYLVLEDDQNYTNVHTSTGNPTPEVGYDGSTMKPKGIIKSFDILLGNEDTAWFAGATSKKFAVNQEIPAGKSLAVVFHYHPGYSYNSNSNLYTDLNAFQLLTYKEDTTNFYSYRLDTPTTFNQATFLDYNLRHQLYTGDYEIWNHKYNPAYWAQDENSSHNADHLVVYYKVSRFENTSGDEDTTIQDTVVVNPIDTTSGGSDTTSTSSSDTISTSTSDTVITSHSDTIISSDTVTIINNDTVWIRDTIEIEVIDTITITVIDTIQITNNDTIVITDTILVSDANTETIQIDITGICDNVISSLNEGEVPDNLSATAYPNPVSDKLKIEVTNSSNITTMELNIYDVTGSLMTSVPFFGSTTMSLNFSQFQAGLYFIEVIGDGQVLLQQGIIKN